MIGKVSLSPAFSGKVIVGKNKEDRARMVRDFDKMPDAKRAKVEEKMQDFKKVVEGGTDDNVNILLEVMYLENGSQRRPGKPRIHARISQTFPGEDRYDRPILAKNGLMSNQDISKVFDDLARKAVKYANCDCQHLDMNA